MSSPRCRTPGNPVTKGSGKIPRTDLRLVGAQILWTPPLRPVWWDGPALVMDWQGTGAWVLGPTGILSPDVQRSCSAVSSIYHHQFFLCYLLYPATWRSDIVLCKWLLGDICDLSVCCIYMTACFDHSVWYGLVATGCELVSRRAVN